MLVLLGFHLPSQIESAELVYSFFFFLTSYLETNSINIVFIQISHWRGRIAVKGKLKVFSSFLHCVQFVIKLSVPTQLFLELFNH